MCALTWELADYADGEDDLMFADADVNEWESAFEDETPTVPMLVPPEPETQRCAYLVVDRNGEERRLR